MKKWEETETKEGGMKRSQVCEIVEKTRWERCEMISPHSSMEFHFNHQTIENELKNGKLLR